MRSSPSDMEEPTIRDPGQRWRRCCTSRPTKMASPVLRPTPVVSAQRASQPTHEHAPRPSIGRALGLGLITGAADDDPSAIGTYATAGAKIGPSFLWTAPVTFPMMVAVVYLSSKLGQVTGKGLFDVIRESYSRPLLFATLGGVLIGNAFEAAADLGGMAAALQLVLPWRLELLVVGIAVIIVALQ